jgi:hypothetical protein
MSESLAELRRLAQHLNGIARSVIEEDGDHAAMFFLRMPDGTVEADLFSDSHEHDLAHALDESDADAVVVVFETMTEADAGSLVVAGVDRDANTVVLVTPRVDGGGLGATADRSDGYRVPLLDAARDAWDDAG